MAFSEDGAQLASSSKDSSLCLWDVGTGDPCLLLFSKSQHRLGHGAMCNLIKMQQAADLC